MHPESIPFRRWVSIALNYFQHSSVSRVRHYSTNREDSHRMQPIDPEVLVERIRAVGIILIRVHPFICISWAKRCRILDRAGLWIGAWVVENLVEYRVGVEEEDCGVRVAITKLWQCLRKISVIALDETSQLVFALSVVPLWVGGSFEWSKFQNEKVAGTSRVQRAQYLNVFSNVLAQKALLRPEVGITNIWENRAIEGSVYVSDGYYVVPQITMCLPLLMLTVQAKERGEQSRVRFPIEFFRWVTILRNPVSLNLRFERPKSWELRPKNRAVYCCSTTCKIDGANETLVPRRREVTGPICADGGSLALHSKGVWENLLDKSKACSFQYLTGKSGLPIGFSLDGWSPVKLKETDVIESPKIWVPEGVKVSTCLRHLEDLRPLVPYHQMLDSAPPWPVWFFGVWGSRSRSRSRSRHTWSRTRRIV